MLILNRDEHGDLPVLPVPTDPRRMHQHPAVVLGKTQHGFVVFVITSQKTSDERDLAVDLDGVKGTVVPIPVFVRDITGFHASNISNSKLQARLQGYALHARDAIIFDRKRMLAAGYPNPLYMH